MLARGLGPKLLLVSMAADQEYIDGWRARRHAEALAAAQWRRERSREAAHAAARLGEFAGVCRVVLFGSLARDAAEPGSDVDLWVEGLAEADWLAAVAAARALVSDAEVDLVRAEWAGAGIAAQVAGEGRVLYVR